MSAQLAFTIAAATVGLVAAILFCVGNAMNAAKDIYSQATPYWDFSEPVARALTMQRAQYVVGAVLLLIAFVLQLAAALTPGDRKAALPYALDSWCNLLAAILVPVAVASWMAVRIAFRHTLRKVLALESADRAEEERIEAAKAARK